MQLSNLLGAYQNSTSAPAGVNSKRGVQQLVSSLQDLKSGYVFEGTVNSVKGGKVVLGLPNGQTISARLDGSVSLTQGDSMFFQVKSNDGSLIAIRPYTISGNQLNLTLVDALSAANIPVDDKNLKMVHAMMQDGMPIDRDSLAEMARLVSGNPTANVDTLVEMKNLKLAISPEMISQFENYKSDQHAITNELADFMKALPVALTEQNIPAGDMAKLIKNVIEILTEGLDTTSVGLAENELAEASDSLAQQSQTPGLISDGETIVAGNTAPAETTTAGGNPESAEELVLRNAIEGDVSKAAGEVMKADGTLGAILGKTELSELTNLLFEADLLPNGQVLEAKENAMYLLSEIGKELQIQTENGSNFSSEKLVSLLKAESFAKILGEAMDRQWFIKPDDLGDGTSKQISKLYEHLKDQLNRIENAVRATGQEAASLSRTADVIRSNVDFMNEINQHYQFVQIPLLMNGKHASGDLYVYTNKKNSAEENGELSAFLHLDMDHLGATDVAVRMVGKQVDTKFYFDNDASYALVEAHTPELEERLRKKGYNCTIHVMNEGKKMDFVEDFLKQDSVPIGMVHRYSFDMRA